LGRIAYVLLLVVMVGGLWLYADSKRADAEQGKEFSKPLISAADGDTSATPDDTLAPEEPSTEEAGG